LFFKNLRNFFVDYVRNGAVGTVAHIFKLFCDDSVCRSEGIVRIVHHGKIVFSIAHTDQDLSAQPLLQFPGRPGFGNAFGVNIDDPGGGPEYLAVGAEPLFQQFSALFFQ
jgi:hypothetical protein